MELEEQRNNHDNENTAIERKINTMMKVVMEVLENSSDTELQNKFKKRLYEML